MTCFWDGVFRSLNEEDKTILGLDKICKRENIIKVLMERNCIVNTLWQGEELREQEKKEHFQAVKDYDVRKIYGGHWTSTCDSFLLLICQVLKVDISHRYLNTMISYKYSGKARKVLKFKSNRGHFEIMR
jgi:hypothetical protein